MPPVPPQIEVIHRVRLWPLWMRAGGATLRINMGAWAVYVPHLRLKLMHAAQGGVQACLYHKAPRRRAVLDWADTDAGRAALAAPLPDPLGNQYARPAWPLWHRVYTMPVTRRVAENWVMFARLHAAGLGPEPLGLVAVRDYRSWFSGGVTVSAGLRLANLYDMPPRAPVTEAELRAAGVIPDASLASIREPINGYVSDLNSLRGAMPEAAEAEVAAIAAALEARLAGAG